ncbi:hypothetical protein [Lysinibacillus sp. NPDC056185]|uniref:hypothetical protein n=1 Tax=Lysinibacillus sp. NPDC056185 TaxID=3345739 RepID=UPI0039EFD77E
MEQQLINETKESYFNYVNKISRGCRLIAEDLRQGKMAIAFQNIIDLAEGLNWLISVEDKMSQLNITVNSSIKEASEFFIEINIALEQENYILVADLFEYEVQALFEASEDWTFEKKVEN